MKEIAAAQTFPHTLTFADVDRARTFCIAARMQRGVAAQRASRARAIVRQHFLKQDAVFFVALVYSGCRASRSPSARSG